MNWEKNKNVANLLNEYKRSLSAKTVTAEAADLTHEICIQLRSVLDRVAYRCWTMVVAPALSEKDQKSAKSGIHFPGATTQASFDSTLGKWRLNQANHPVLHSYLRAQQPFANSRNKWLAVLFDLAVQGKHLDLVPQKRIEQPRIAVERPGISIDWNPEMVRFTRGPGISASAAGARIDPQTQRVVPTEGVTEKIETWVSFIIDGYGVNAATFCAGACRETRRIAQEMTDQFGLS